MVLAAVALTIDIPALAPRQSLAARVLTAVERQLLRALAFVLARIDRCCATAALQGYLLLQAQLPASAARSLDRAAASVKALADASFTDFWLSLLGSEGEAASTLLAADSRAESGRDDKQNLVARLYEYITCSILGLFMGSSSSNTDKKQHRNLTPCTSPVNTERRRSRRRPASSLENDYWDPDEDDDDDDGDDFDMLEPGWAVEYMQQELMLPTDMKRRMESMMHSSVPLNLFRAKVQFPSCDADSDASEEDDDCSSCASNLRGFIGAVTPGSLPPTPVTRDLQARRMHHYTVFVLDHTTLALQMLETSCS